MKSSWLFAPLLAWVKGNASILISRFTREGRKILVVFPFPDRSGTVLFLTLKSSYSNSLIEWRAVGFMACYFIAVYNPYLTIEKEVSSVLSAGREQGLDWGMKLLVQDHSPFQLSFPPLGVASSSWVRLLSQDPMVKDRWCSLLCRMLYWSTSLARQKRYHRKKVDLTPFPSWPLKKESVNSAHLQKVEHAFLNLQSVRNRSSGLATAN